MNTTIYERTDRKARVIFRNFWYRAEFRAAGRWLSCGATRDREAAIGYANSAQTV